MCMHVCVLSFVLLVLTYVHTFRSGNNELIGMCTTSLKDICPERYTTVHRSYSVIKLLHFFFCTVPLSCLLSYTHRGGTVHDLELTNPSQKNKKKSPGVLVFNSVK